jgi:hypothetical protein
MTADHFVQAPFLEITAYPRRGLLTITALHTKYPAIGPCTASAALPTIHAYQRSYQPSPTAESLLIDCEQERAADESIIVDPNGTTAQESDSGRPGVTP